LTKGELQHFIKGASLHQDIFKLFVEREGKDLEEQVSRKGHKPKR
jgi:hypothetical protein